MNSPKDVLHKRSFKDCTIEEGSFNMSEEEMLSIVCENSGEKSAKKLFNYHVTIRSKFELVNNTCPIKFRSTFSNLHSSRFTLLAICLFDTCKYFKITLEVNTIGAKGIVQSTNINYNHPSESGKMTTYVRNYERRLLGCKLLNSTPFKQRSADINSTPAEQILCGNLRTIKSKEVYKKIKSEEISKLDRDKDEMIDLHKMHDENPEYIFRVFKPFTIYIFSKEQCAVLQYVAKSCKKLVLNLDATGSVVHPPAGNLKRILYYAGVVHLEDKKAICPVLEMLTDAHTASSISEWLLAFQHYCNNLNLKWPIFNYVVTDFSFALINAIIYEWNKLNDLSEYTNIVYDQIHGIHTERQIVIELKICCSHLMKIIASNVNKICALMPKKRRNLIKYWIGSIFNATDLKTVTEWFKLFIHVCMTRDFNPGIKRSVHALNSLIGDIERYQEMMDEECEDITPQEDSYYTRFNTDTGKTLYKRSQFYLYFLSVFEENGYAFENEKYFNNGTNLMYKPEMVRTVMVKYLSFLPLWSNIWQGDENKRYSNAIVEDWFGILKKNVLPGSHLRVSRFLRTTREVVLSTAKICSLDIAPSRLAIRKKRPTENSVENPMQEEEKWNKHKNKKVKHSYLKSDKFLAPKTSVKEASASQNQKIDLCLPTNVTREIDKEGDAGRQIGLKIMTSVQLPEKLTFLENGLVSNYEEYYTENKINYVVGIFPGAQPFEDLRIADFSTLAYRQGKHQWVANFVLDICIHLFKRQSPLFHVEIIDSQQSYRIFSHAVNAPKISLSQGKVYIMPLNLDNNHWCLAIADLRTYRFYYLDPLNSSISKTKTYLSKFLNYYNIAQPTLLARKTIHAILLQHPRQKDSDNCGIYILAFAEKFLSVENRNLFEVSEPEDLRMRYRQMLCENSAEMKQRCLICGDLQSNNATAQWVQCNYCRRWIMIDCLLQKKLPVKIDTRLYMCFVCEQFFISTQ